MRKGYQVVSIDASGEVVAAASRLTGQSAVLMRFDEVAFDGEFDADWACASLLHVARRDLQSAVGRMVLAASASQIVSSDLEIFLAMLVFYHSRKGRWRAGTILRIYRRAQMNPIIEQPSRG